MFKHRILTVVLPLIVCSGGFVQLAHAEENGTGPYVGAGVGQFNAKIDNIEGVTDTIRNLDSSDDVAYKVFFGWRFAPYFSLEADYIDLGTPSANFSATGSDGEYKVDLSGFGLYAIGTLPIGIFDLFAKAGYYWHDVTIDVNFDNLGPNNGNAFESDESGEAWAYGVGAGVTLIDHLNVNIEYEMLDIDRLKDTYTLWLNGAWRF